MVKELAKLHFRGDGGGLIDGFNVLVNQLPTTFWSGFCERMPAAVPDETKPIPEGALLRWGYECGSHKGIWDYHIQRVPGHRPPDGYRGRRRCGARRLNSLHRLGLGEVRNCADPGGRTYGCSGRGRLRVGWCPGTQRGFLIRSASEALFELAHSAPYPDGMGSFECGQTDWLEPGDGSASPSSLRSRFFIERRAEVRYTKEPPSFGGKGGGRGCERRNAAPFRFRRAC